MSASLVGSEMCIRDSPPGQTALSAAPNRRKSETTLAALPGAEGAARSGCLLYTSDAADDM
eukprot:627582-Alexandrium_andersonii.AAC.1